MLEKERVERAVDIQNRSYRLLLWLETAMEKGFVRFDRAHEYLEAHEAAMDWITVHFHNLPPESRPERDSLEAFARFFATYLFTSFDIVEKAGGRRVTGGCGCYCPFCSYLVAAPHLRPKKLTGRDRTRALSLKVRRILRLAAEEGIGIREEAAERIAADPEARADTALAAYGEALVARMSGVGGGPAVLALWREFARDSHGAPLKGFELSAEAILRAEEHLLARIRTEGARPGAPGSRVVDFAITPDELEAREVREQHGRKRPRRHR